jgi:hypothetical protein
MAVSQDSFIGNYSPFSIYRGYTVVRLVDALRYKVAVSIPDDVIGILH